MLYFSKMRKIIHKYIIREILGPFLIGIVIFTFILIISNLVRLTEMIVAKGAGVSEVVKLFLGIIPAFLSLTLPMAFLLGVMIALSRLSAENEISALKSSGIGMGQIYRPIFFLSIFTILLNLGITLFAAPLANYNFRQHLFKLLKNRITLGLKEKVFNHNLGRMVFYANSIRDQGKTIQGILINLSDPALFPHPVLISAREGNFQPSPEQFIYLKLTQGEIQTLGQDLKKFQSIHFSDLLLKLDLNRMIPEVASPKKKLKELTLPELRREIQSLPGNHPDRFLYLTELERRFAIPFSPLAFGIIGLPLGIHNRRRLGRGFGFVVTILLLLLYYLLLHFGEMLGIKGYPLAMWLPNLFLIVLGTYLFIRAYFEFPFLPMEWALSSVEKFRSRFSNR